MTRGRRKTTGRFQTREELCEWVWNTYWHTKASAADIAKQCRVSEGTVNNILNSLEGRPTDKELL